MKTPNWVPIILRISDNLKLKISFLPEDINGKSYFMGDCGWTETQYNTIKDYYFFTCKYELLMNDISLDFCEYIGAMCYKNKKDFLQFEGQTENSEFFYNSCLREIVGELLQQLKGEVFPSLYKELTKGLIDL